MKLTPEIIAKIEDMIDMHDSNIGGRAIIIKYDISELNQLSAFFSILRSLGVSISRKPGRAKGTCCLPVSEVDQYRAWLKEKRVEKDGAVAEEK